MSTSHVYSNAGTYTAQLTVTDNGSATATDSKLITVSAIPSGTVHVESQTLSRVTLPGNKIACEDVVLIKDDVGSPASGAVVFATYTGPTSGTVSGTTGSNGEVTLQSSKIRNPSGVWTFAVTGVQMAGMTYDPTANLITTITEGTPKKDGEPLLSCELRQNYPNPFVASTNIEFSVPVEQHIRLIVTDMLGREVACLVDGSTRAGMNTATFDASQLPAGIYTVQLKTSDGTLVRTMLLLK